MVEARGPGLRLERAVGVEAILRDEVGAARPAATPGRARTARRSRRARTATSGPRRCSSRTASRRPRSRRPTARRRRGSAAPSRAFSSAIGSTLPVDHETCESASSRVRGLTSARIASSASRAPAPACARRERGRRKRAAARAGRSARRRWSRPRRPDRARARRGRCCSRLVVEPVSATCSGLDADQRRETPHAACVAASPMRSQTAGPLRPSLEIAAASAAHRLGRRARERPERAGVQVREPLEHGKLGAGLLKLHVIYDTVPVLAGVPLTSAGRRLAADLARVGGDRRRSATTSSASSTCGASGASEAWRASSEQRRGGGRLPPRLAATSARENYLPLAQTISP